MFTIDSMTFSILFLFHSFTITSIFHISGLDGAYRIDLTNRNKIFSILIYTYKHILIIIIIITPTYRALNLLDAKVVLLLLPLPVGDDVEGGEDDEDDQEDCNAADDEDRPPAN